MAKKKVYAVMFHWEDDYELEGIFETKEGAKNYIFNQAIERGLHIPDDISIKEVGLQKDHRKNIKDIEMALCGWGCDTEEGQKEFLDRFNAEIEAL